MKINDKRRNTKRRNAKRGNAKRGGSRRAPASSGNGAALQSFREGAEFFGPGGEDFFNQATAYRYFLDEMGLQDMKEELTEYLTEGEELQELQQMDPDELDEDILDEIKLFIHEATKKKFHTLLKNIQWNKGDTESDKQRMHRNRPDEDGSFKPLPEGLRPRPAPLVWEESVNPWHAGMPAWATKTERPRVDPLSGRVIDGRKSPAEARRLSGKSPRELYDWAEDYMKEIQGEGYSSTLYGGSKRNNRKSKRRKSTKRKSTKRKYKRR
jgi:hypothetical protein